VAPAPSTGGSRSIDAAARSQLTSRRNSSVSGAERDGAQRVARSETRVADSSFADRVDVADCAVLDVGHLRRFGNGRRRQGLLRRAPFGERRVMPQPQIIQADRALQLQVRDVAGLDLHVQQTEQQGLCRRVIQVEERRAVQDRLKHRFRDAQPRQDRVRLRRRPRATSRNGEHAGNLLKAIPQRVLSAGLSRAARDGFSATLGATFVGETFLDDANTRRLAGPTQLDARASYPVLGTRLSLDVRNLLGKEYSSTGFPDPAGSDVTLLYPAAGRVVMVGIESRF
jgi:hypothetical protein